MTDATTKRAHSVTCGGCTFHMAIVLREAREAADAETWTITVHGRTYRYATLEAAKDTAERVFAATGIVLAIEAGGTCGRS